MSKSAASRSAWHQIYYIFLICDSDSSLTQLGPTSEAINSEPNSCKTDHSRSRSASPRVWFEKAVNLRSDWKLQLFDFQSEE